MWRSGQEWFGGCYGMAQQPFRDEERAHLSTTHEQEMAALCVFCSALLFFWWFFCLFVSFCDQLKSEPGPCVDARRRGWSIGTAAGWMAAGGSQRLSDKYWIFAGSGCPVCSMYTETDPGFAAESIKSGQSPKMRIKGMISAVSGGLDDTLGRQSAKAGWKSQLSWAYTGTIRPHADGLSPPPWMPKLI